MNNYLLSVDPSMKNTGFTLWENKKPIWIDNFSFNNKKWDFSNFVGKIFYQCQDNSNLNLIIERGIFNPKFGKGKETLDHLRGFIAGQFNKLLTKDMLISSKEWRKWYIKNYPVYCWGVKWNKDISLLLTNELIKLNNWNIEIKDHDQAESLLIGWYYLNKENK